MKLSVISESVVDQYAKHIHSLPPGQEKINARLMFADWLDEHGDPRGQYIRATIELYLLVYEYRSKRLNISQFEFMNKRQEYNDVLTDIEEKYPEYFPKQGYDAYNILNRIQLGFIYDDARAIEAKERYKKAT